MVYEESPVLLIDDIDAELDRGRIEALISSLEGRAQTFVSTSRRAIAARYQDRGTVFCVSGGRARQEGARPGKNGGPETVADPSYEKAGELERTVSEIAMEGPGRP